MTTFLFCCSFKEGEPLMSHDVDLCLNPRRSWHAADRSFFTHASESSYNSDQGSGNEDGRDINLIIYEESSDEVELLSP